MKLSAYLGLFLASFIVSIGTFWAFQKGANDFSVFYEAWRLVSSSRGADLYHATPDRFLYAPGFAWLFFPLGLLPKGIALAIWCFAKAAVVGWIVRSFSLALGYGWRGLNAAAWGVVWVARPLLIDFQYGQVNTFILGACVWALLNHFQKKSNSILNYLCWTTLAVAAVTKLFPLPLLLVPFALTLGISEKKLWQERIGILIGLTLILLVPLVSQGTGGTFDLYHQWKDALISRGLPLESHNQSFSAFLHHVFSGQPIHVIAKGIAHPIQMGVAWLNQPVLSTLSVAWMLLMGGILFGWLLTGSSKRPLPWIAILIGLLILPSHLVWKPYFLMGLPAAVLAMTRWESAWPLLMALLALENFTGFDWVGSKFGAWFEGGAVFLWAHLILLGIIAYYAGEEPLFEN